MGGVRRAVYPGPLGPLFDVAAQLGGELLEFVPGPGWPRELFAALPCQVSGPGTLGVVVVEEVYWADEATLDMLRSLAGASRTPPCCSLPATGTRIWPREPPARRLVSLPGSAPPGRSSWAPLYAGASRQATKP